MRPVCRCAFAVLLGVYLAASPVLGEEPRASVSVHGNENISVIDNKGHVEIRVANKGVDFEFLNKFKLDLVSIREVVSSALRSTNTQGERLQAYLGSVLDEQAKLHQRVLALSEQLRSITAHIDGLGWREIMFLYKLDTDIGDLSRNHMALFSALSQKIESLQRDARRALVATVRRSRIERYGYALLLGAGGALAVAGGLAGIAVYWDRRAKSDCDGDFCGSRGLGYRHRAVHLGNASTGFLVGSAAVAAASGVTFLIARSAEIQDRQSAVELSAGVGAGVASITITGRW